MLIFPAHLFNPKEVNARPVQRVISGGQALSGEEDVIATDGGGRWRVDYSGISLHTPEQQRRWSAWQAQLAGGVTECLVPLLSLATAPRSFIGKSPMPVAQLVTDDPLFPTAAAFANPHIVAALTANAALRATVVAISVTQGATIEGGEKFGIGERAYRVVRPAGGGTYTIEPPLRQAVSIGAAVNFDWPVVRCRMVPDDYEGALSLGRYGDKSISFIESFTS